MKGTADISPAPKSKHPEVSLNDDQFCPTADAIDLSYDFDVVDLTDDVEESSMEQAVVPSKEEKGKDNEDGGRNPRTQRKLLPFVALVGVALIAGLLALSIGLSCRSNHENKQTSDQDLVSFNGKSSPLSTSDDSLDKLSGTVTRSSTTTTTTRSSNFGDDLDTGVCEDFPEWSDSQSYDCDWYGLHANCCSQYGHLYPNPDGHTANQACCVCGGGIPADAITIRDLSGNLCLEVEVDEDNAVPRQGNNVFMTQCDDNSLSQLWIRTSPGDPIFILNSMLNPDLCMDVERRPGWNVHMWECKTQNSFNQEFDSGLFDISGGKLLNGIGGCLKYDTSINDSTYENLYCDQLEYPDCEGSPSFQFVMPSPQDQDRVDILVCPTDSPIDAASAFEDAVEAVLRLHRAIDDYDDYYYYYAEIPDHLIDYENYNPELKDGDFDVATYLDVLPHISLPPGKVLEYFYIFDGMGGYPKLYVRNNNTEHPFRTYEQFLDNNCQEDYPCLEEWGGSFFGQGNYLDHFLLDGTMESYVELVTLMILGGQIYLFWHSQYYDDRIIYSNDTDTWAKSALGSITDGSCSCYHEDFVDEDWFYYGCLSDDAIDIVRAMDLTPKVECNDEDGDEMVQVSVVQYSNWGGFVRKTYSMIQAGVGSDGGALIDIVDSEDLFYFFCGIMYR